jgi:hypothetical protein
VSSGQKITSYNVDGGTRTHGLRFRKPLLYPLSYTDMLFNILLYQVNPFVLSAELRPTATMIAYSSINARKVNSALPHAPPLTSVQPRALSHPSTPAYRGSSLPMAGTEILEMQGGATSLLERCSAPCFYGCMGSVL